MAANKLSAQKLKHALPGKYEDGAGLRVVITKQGSGKWVFRYTLKGKRREMGLGTYPRTSLAKARSKASAARNFLDEGIDPIEERNAEAIEIPTFTTCAARYIRAQRHGWRNRKHARQWVSTLKTYARPKVGDKQVDEIETADVLQILGPIWNTKTETAKRVQGRVENILDYAAAHNYRNSVNPARWRGHLDKLLPRPSRIKTVVHHPAMPYTDLPAFLDELAKNDAVSVHALRFLILTATRTGEVIGAMWDEIDTEAAVWTIPASRMKARREHRVPLSEQALATLDALPRFESNPYVFPGSRSNRPLSNMAMLQLMRGMAYGAGGARGNYVPHGFRSSFRDWSGEVSTFPRDVAEMALAHVIENKVEAAYRRGDLFAKRRRMMQAWGDFVTQPAKNGSATNIASLANDRGLGINSENL